MKISEVTRRNIFDSLVIEKTIWSGRLAEPDFLSRIFDVHSLPTNDGRFENAYGDIWQHRINNYDWEDDWIFTDDRFDLLHCDDEILLRFLCEIIHPVVRSEPQEAERLQQLFNSFLKEDGYEIIETTKISGRPVFSARQLLSGPPSLKSAKELADTFDATYLSKQITRLETSIESDPDLAIGTSKELVESCCKTILNEKRVSYDKNWDIIKLLKSTLKELQLTPDDIPDSAKASKTIKKLLNNLASLTQSMAELRNAYGTGHGREAKSKGLTSRHAKLIVGIATALTTFLFETKEVR